MKLVYVEWLDASGLRGPFSMHQATQKQPLLMRSAGILVRTDEQMVTFAMDSWTDDHDDGTKPQIVREIVSIPRVLVQRMVEWDPDAVPTSTPTTAPSMA